MSLQVVRLLKVGLKLIIDLFLSIRFEDAGIEADAPPPVNPLMSEWFVKWV